MNLSPINVQSIRLNHPLPFHLVDKTGLLLAKKGFVIETEKNLIEIANRGGGIYIDLANPDNHAPKNVQRAFVEELQTMVRNEKLLGEIAGARAPFEAGSKRVAAVSDRVDWLDLQVQANTLLRTPGADTFPDRFHQLTSVLTHHLGRNPDGALFALFYLSASDTRMYSAIHSLLISSVCVLAAKEVLNWPGEDVTSLFHAALTMNIGMTALQDKLAIQKTTVDARQRAEIDGHAVLGAEILQSLGVTDPVWLEAVRLHHTHLPGALAERSTPERLARLIQRADNFCARLAPRISRAATPSATAMKACYFDEQSRVDEAGAAVIKAVGIYQPGTFVKLVTGEIAVVLRRGATSSAPKVAVVMNKMGTPTGEPPVRDTAQKAFAVASSVPHRDIKVNLNLERMLALTLVA